MKHSLLWPFLASLLLPLAAAWFVYGNGLVREFWNHGSEYPNPLAPVVPLNYWVYDVPYVNVIHLYSEMPLLGYFGYLPFGILIWVWFIWAGKLFGFDTSLTDISVSE